MPAIGKVLILFGVVLILVGLGFLFAHKIPFVGRLPGDILVKKENFTFYFPLTTSIIVSILLTLIFWLFRR